MESGGGEGSGDGGAASATCSNNSDAKHHVLTSAASAAAGEGGSALTTGKTTPPLSSVSKEFVAPEVVVDGNTKNKGSPTSVDAFDLFMTELQEAEEAEEAEATSFSEAAITQLTQKEIAQHNINIAKLAGIANKEDLDLMDMGTRRVQNLRELQEECTAAAAVTATKEGSSPCTGFSKLANIIRQKECLLIKLSTRLSGVTRKLAKKERDVDRLKAAFEEMKDKHKLATRSDRKHIEEIRLIAGKLKLMEKDLEAKEDLVEQLGNVLESSKIAYQRELAASEKVHKIAIEQYADDATKLGRKIQELEESHATRCQELESAIREKVAELAEVKTKIGDIKVYSPSEKEISSISDDVRVALSILNADQSRRSDAEKDAASLKAHEVKLRISKMEQDNEHKDSELSELAKILFTDDGSLPQGHASVSERASRLVEDLVSERSLKRANQSDLNSLKLEVDQLQNNLAKAEEDLFERNVEISGVRSLLEDNSFLLCDDASSLLHSEQTPPNLSIYDSTLQLVSELSTERDRSEIARDKAAKLEEEVESLSASLDRLKDLELEIGNKDLTITSLSQQLEATQDQAAKDVAALNQAADEKSGRHKAEMEARMAELEISHVKLCEELEAKLQERDEELEKMKIVLSETESICSIQLALKEKLEGQIRSLEKEATMQQLDYEDRIAKIERQAENRIAETEATHEKVCSELHGLINSMDERLEEVNSTLEQEQNLPEVFVQDTDGSVGVECSMIRTKSAQTFVSNLKAERDLNHSIQIRLQNLDVHFQEQKDEAKEAEVDVMAEIDDLRHEKCRLEAELSAVRDESNADISSIRASAALERTKNESRIRALEEELGLLEKDKEASLEEEAGRHQAAVRRLEASVESLECEIEALKQSLEVAKALTANADDRRAQSDDEICSVKASKEELEARYQALEKEGESTLAKAQKDLKDTQSMLSKSIKALEGERGELAALSEAMRIAEAEHMVEAAETFRNHTETVALLENRIAFLREEREAADETHRREVESLQLSSNEALETERAESAKVFADLNNLREISQNLEKEVAFLRLDLIKKQEIATAKDRKIAEAMNGAELTRIALVSLEQEKRKMSTVIRKLERELKMAETRSKGNLLTAQTEVETLRSALADGKREFTEMEKTKQNEIDLLREEYQGKINDLEEAKKKLSRQLYDLHIAIAGTAKAVASDASDSMPSNPNREARDRIAALRAQKDLIIKQVRMEMQEIVDAKEQELGALKRGNTASWERIESLEQVLEVKEGELIELKRAVDEKSFYENAAAYDESDVDDDTIVGSPTRKGSFHENPQDCEVIVPLASRQNAVRVIPLPRLILSWLIEFISFIFIRIPLKAASLCMAVCLASLMLLWFGAAIAILWSYLADDNGAMKIGAAINYRGNGLGFALYNI